MDAWLRDTRVLAVVALVVLVALAPVFAWAAGQVGYAEPLENAAEETGAADDARPVHDGLLPDYGVPGLGSAAGTLVAAAVGTALTLAVATGIGRVLGGQHDPD
ncbi:PDGLE domain-containing protein [Halorientalis litorea]|jgi:cobalt/nickel transport protein|uniref:PDGLE domain-containing protein n=1 Tax=Halorientalis litorea TaxID=2931977 RepID=UPI001FF1CFE9|nr:PDGLE domain-containing protein [Halorientalis litorea]